MTNEQNIYECLMTGLADKELRFGCQIKYWSQKYREWTVGIVYKTVEDMEGNIWQVHTIADNFLLADFSLDKERTNKRMPYLKPEQVLGHDIMLGDVLARYTMDDSHSMKIIMYLWHDCGADKSLQDLYESTEVVFGDCKSNCPEPWCEDCIGILKDPNIEALFRYLIELNIINLER